MHAMIILMFGLAAGVAEPTNLEHELRCLETAFSRSAERRDAVAFAGFLDADARFVTGETLRGPDAVVAAWTAFLTDGGPAIRWRPEIVEVAASGDLALTRGPYRIRRENPGGEAIESWGTFTSVWRKGQGGWRVLFDAGGDHGLEPSEARRQVLASEPDCEAESS